MISVIYIYVYSVLLVPCIISCHDHDLLQNKAARGDYFPLTPGSQWTYVTKFHCYFPDTSKMCYDTATYFVGGIINPWDSAFVPISASFGTVKWIKAEENKYYTMGWYVPEYMFLDANMLLNGSWEQGNGYSKEIFTITAVNAVKVVNDVTYKNVIEVQRIHLMRNSPDVWEEAGRSYHYYARNVGEIYTYYPKTPYRLDNISVSLINYHRT